MKHLRFFLVVILMVAALPVVPAFAQQTPSAGCTAVSGVQTANPTASAGQQTLAAGEVVSVSVSGPGTSFELRINGSPVATALIGSIASYSVPSAGSYLIEVFVNGATTPNTQASFGCEVGGAGDDDDGESGKVTICHIPPGNPGNAHTITVGRPALQAHLGHGDTEGACSEEVESRFDNGNGVITFTDEGNGKIEIWGQCSGEICIQIAIVNLLILLPREGAEFEFDSETTDWHVIVFYLGKSHTDPTVSVFQLNIYNGANTLLDDHVLIFIDAQGNIRWDERKA